MHVKKKKKQYKIQNVNMVECMGALKCGKRNCKMDQQAFNEAGIVMFAHIPVE